MTDRTQMDGANLPALEEALARYGSDRTRWPAPVRRTFAGLLSADREAQARLREAEALDRLLDLAPRPDIDTRPLADRIMAVVETERGAVAPVVAPDASPMAATRGPRWPQAFSRSRIVGSGRTHGPAAALLAASLMIGAFTGLNGTVDSTVGPFITTASAVDTTYEADMDPGQIAFDSDTIALFEEDFL